MSTRRCWPPERVLTSSSARSARPTTSRHAAISGVAGPRRAGGRHHARWGSRPTATISVDRGPHRGREGVPLRDVAQPRVARRSARAGRRTAGPRRPSWLVEAEEALHQRRLARAVGAEQRHDLAGVRREVDVGHDRRVGVAEGRVPSSMTGRTASAGVWLGARSRASLPGSQGREVAAHHLKVVRCRPTASVSPSMGSSTATPGAGLAARGSRRRPGSTRVSA